MKTLLKEKDTSTAIESKYRTLLDAVPALVYAVDKNLNYTYVNKAFCKFYNIEPAVALTSTLPELAGKEAYKALEKYILKALHGEVVRFETVVSFPEKDYFFEATFTPETDEKGEVIGYMAFAQETTAKRKALLEGKEEELRKSEERYHKMIEEVEDYAIILLDAEGNILDWNMGAQKIKGYTTKEALGMNFSVFYLPQDRERKLPQQLLDTARRTGRASHEGLRVKKDGTTFWGSIVITALHDENNNVIGFTKVTKDLTKKKIEEDKRDLLAEELRKKNEQLIESEERYHKMIDEVEDYAILMLDREGNIQNWNKGAEKIKGYKPEDIIGQHFSIFYRKVDKDKGLPNKLLNEAREKGKATHEGWRVRKDGTEFWGSIVITALHDSKNNIIGFSKVTRDLTDKKLAEDKLKDYANQLENQNKELDHFAYAASHDLQEPLRKIITFNSLIQEHEGEKLSDKARDYFNRSISAAERMNKLIEDLLTYSRATRDRDEIEQVDLNTIIDRIKASYKEVEGKVRIESEKLPTLKGLRFQFEQLFENLINNAIKYQSEANLPVIKLTCDVVFGDEMKEMLVEPDKKFYKISISDNGIGFQQEYADKIFEMFQRLHGKSEYSGTGIGLAIVKRIVQHYNGFITAEGRPGEGATFHMYFPA